MAYEDRATEYAQRYGVLSGGSKIEDAAIESYHYPIARHLARSQGGEYTTCDRCGRPLESSDDPPHCNRCRGYKL